MGGAAENPGGSAGAVRPAGVPRAGAAGRADGDPRPVPGRPGGNGADGGRAVRAVRHPRPAEAGTGLTSAPTAAAPSPALSSDGRLDTVGSSAPLAVLSAERVVSRSPAKPCPGREQLTLH